MRETFRYSIFAGLLTLALFLAPFDFISNAQLSGEPDVKTMASALDENQNRVLDDAEILSAIQLWILGEALPDGETIDDESILSLVQLWITGEAISNPPPMGDDVGEDVGEIAGFDCPSIGRLPGHWGSEGSGDGQFNQPQGIAADHKNHKNTVYVADTFNNRIQKFSSTGTFITKWGSEGSGDGQFNWPLGVAVDNYGNVYVADSNNNRIQKFNSTGTFITKWGSEGSGDGQFSGLSGIAMDKEDHVYVADVSNNRIQKFTSTGTFITKWGSEGSGDGQFIDPLGVAVDHERNVYVVDNGNHRIQVFTSTGAYLNQWGSKGESNGEFSRPFGVAVDGKTADRPGDVFVTDVNQSTTQKFDPTGKFIYSGGSEHLDGTPGPLPSAIAVDSAGVIYTVETGNNRIIVGCNRSYEE